MVDKNAHLKDLALALSPFATLYEVGGCVRDSLMGIECYDIDVCSKLKVDDVKKALLNTDFVVSDRSLRMGTVHISRGDFVCEYTTFRTDSYDVNSGEHTPKSVEFTTDICLDAKRRDFKCNAIYKDALTGEIVDVLGGVEDIKNKVLSTADNPQAVFEADGLRILRLVRFCAELGFDIEEKTFECANQNAWRVKDIAIERVRDELERIFVADTRHPELCLFNAHARGIRLLDRLGLVELLLPELASLKGLEQNKKYHLYDAYTHSLKAYEYATPNIRASALLHDIGKSKSVEIQGDMHLHAMLGADMARDIANRYKLSNEKKNRLVKLVSLHMLDINGDMSISKLRREIAKNADVVDDLCALMEADARATNEQLPKENRVRQVFEEMKKDGTPFSVKQLKVSGNDLVKIGIDQDKRGVVLNNLWLDTVMNLALNTREKALEYVKKCAKKLENQDIGEI